MLYNKYSEVRDSSAELEAQYIALPVNGQNSIYVGMTVEGFPCLFIKLVTVDGQYIPNVMLQYLSVRFNVPCSLGVKGETFESKLTVVSCPSFEQEIVRYFFSVCESLLDIVGKNISASELSRAVSRLASIFQNIAKPARGSVTGLVGELLIIRFAQEPKAVVKAWRRDDDERFDFSSTDCELEIKSTTTGLREHYFSHRQCEAEDSYVASILLEKKSNGCSLRDLLEEIEDLLKNDLEQILKVRSVVAKTLGETLAEAFEFSFDKKAAKSSIQFYELRSIPAIRGELPEGVSSVRFKSDLSKVEPLSIELLQEKLFIFLC